MKEYILSLTKELVSIPSISSDIPQLHAVIDRIMLEFEEFEHATIQKIVHNEKPSLVVSNFEGKR
jgi:acetylornithine deacetylase/succinyl-diaminopimelate desuccinylase-like protein